MKLVSALMIGGLAAFLASCASISREDCVEGDWYGIGERDGRSGHVADSRFARHTDACARVEIRPDRSQWDRGYEAGLAHYCTPQSGLREGRAGRSYRGVCPAATEPRFMQGHSLGMAENRQRERIRRTEREIRQLTAQNRELRDQLDDHDDSRDLRRQLRNNRAELTRLRVDLRLARSALIAAERESRSFLAGL